MGFLREMLRILPLLGVRVFEKPAAISVPPPPADDITVKDTIVVPAKEDGFTEVFLNQDCWYAIRIGGGMLPKIRYIAAYQSSPISAVTHYAPVKRIEPYGEEGKYRLVFDESATAIKPIPLSDASGAMQGPRYTNLKKLLAAKQVSDFFM